MKIVHIYVCDGNGEMEGMFTEDGTLLGAWSLNDADWRSEYMDGFIKNLGHEFVEVSKKKTKQFEKLLKDYFGC